MDKHFEMNWKRGATAVLVVAVITLLVSLSAKNILMPETLSPEGTHVHGVAGPFFENLFKVYIPRRSCMFHEPGVVWLHFVSDFLIALSYFSIPIALVYFVRRRKDLAFHWIFWMFAAFILLCGTTHIIGMWDLWQPLYKIDGIVKLITGLVSLATAITLWPLIPKALAMPSPSQLEVIVSQRTSELAKARLEAERSNLIKDQFLTTLSHELRTPLNAILGWVQILKRKQPDKAIADGLDVIERNSRLQARLIEDLLDMSSILSGKARIESKEFDLKDSLITAIQSIKPTADAKKITIQTNLPEESLVMLGDPARLQQIFWNLLSNAVKFTPQEGTINVALIRQGKLLQAEIKDSGVGINPEFLPYLFDRFSQADSSITRNFGGLGLGLAVCKHLIELHGGKIKGYSEGKGKGSTFKITLPIKSKSEERTASKGLAKDKISLIGTLKGRKILAVDDESDNLELIKVVLSEAGAETFVAGNTNTALEILKTKKPEILLCDISMPDEDGYSFLKRVRKLSAEDGGNVKAIAVTALANPDDQTKSLLAGFESHVSKPFEHEDLIIAILEALDN